MSQAQTPPPSGEPGATAPKTTPAPALDAAKKAKPEGNPAFRAMGLPNWRPKLPSRNWLILWSIVGTWTGTLLYDRHEKKKAQQKWCTLVSHIAHEPLPTNHMPRRLTVFLSAPPADSLSTSREHFVEYVKPILVAAAMDWDVIEGRREGEVRAALSERIRRFRHRHGEAVEVPFKTTATSVLGPMRERIGVDEWKGEAGDLVVGRNTWKEYVRGLHEGWLGPMNPPPAPPPPPAVESPSTGDGEAKSDKDDGSPTAARAEAEEAKATEEKKEEEPPAKPLVTRPYNSPDSYDSSHLPASIPDRFAASIPIHHPHILGFFNTPIRMYRFLTRRYLADDIGRQTAAAVLAASRQYHHSSSSPGASDEPEWEQQSALNMEEKEWHKSIKEPKEYAKERVWLDDVVLDPRIGDRMRRFELTSEDEERARAIGRGAAGIPGRHGREDKER